MIEISSSNQQVFFDPVPDVSFKCNTSYPCTAQQFAQANHQKWHEQIAQQLPNGIGTICRDRSPIDETIDQSACDGTGLPVIKISWTPGGRQLTTDSIVIRITSK
jgi:hypothetical protein